MKTTLLLPTLNEVEGMKAIMPQIDPTWVDQILVLDGGSTDGTIEYCQQNGIEYVIQDQPGMRFAYYSALPKIRGDVIITFSPDGNSVADRIPPLIEKMREGYDMIIVSRYLDDAKSDDDDMVTGFGNWLFTKTVNLFFGSHYTDVMVMYRAVRLKCIFDLELHTHKPFVLVEKLFGTRISWEPLLSARAARMDLKIGEIPGDEPARIGGERKLQVIRWGAAYYTQFIIELFYKLFSRS